MDEKIIPFDLHRMLFGDAPPGFVLEAFLRGLVLYLYMLFIMRLLGKRMAGELTVMEMVLMVTLGGSVAVAIQVPEGGVLMGFVVLTCAFLFERGFAWLTVKSKKFELLSQGQGVTLIIDGVLQIDQMEQVNITPQQIFATLRVKQITHLGEVERLYLEPGGTFSIYKAAADELTGLPVFPPDDERVLLAQKIAKDVRACSHCGKVSGLDHSVCPACHHGHWVQAILTLSNEKGD